MLKQSLAIGTFQGRLNYGGLRLAFKSLTIVDVCYHDEAVNETLRNDDGDIESNS